MNNTVKWILIVVAIIAAIALIIFLWTQYQNSKAQTIPPGGGTTPPVNNSLLNIVSGLFNGAGGWISNLFGGGSNFGLPDCDPLNPGYTTSGKADTRCTTSNGGGCDPTKCSANSGIDQCGFINENC